MEISKKKKKYYLWYSTADGVFPLKSIHWNTSSGISTLLKKILLDLKSNKTWTDMLPLEFCHDLNAVVCNIRTNVSQICCNIRTTNNINSGALFWYHSSCIQLQIDGVQIAIKLVNYNNWKKNILIRKTERSLKKK